VQAAAVLVTLQDPAKLQSQGVSWPFEHEVLHWVVIPG